jgi:hypothetical protein
VTTIRVIGAPSWRALATIRPAVPPMFASMSVRPSSSRTSQELTNFNRFTTTGTGMPRGYSRGPAVYDGHPAGRRRRPSCRIRTQETPMLPLAAAGVSILTIVVILLIVVVVLMLFRSRGRRV